MKLISEEYFYKNRKQGDLKRINITLDFLSPEHHYYETKGGKLFIYDEELGCVLGWDLEERDFIEDDKFLDVSDWSLQKISETLSHTKNCLNLLSNFREGHKLPDTNKITKGTWLLENKKLDISIKFSIEIINGWISGFNFVHYGLDEKSKFPFNIDKVIRKENLINIIIGCLLS